MNPLFITDSLNKKLPALSGSGETCFYVASGKSDEPISELKKLGWKIIYQSKTSF